MPLSLPWREGLSAAFPVEDPPARFVSPEATATLRATPGSGALLFRAVPLRVTGLRRVLACLPPSSRWDEALAFVPETPEVDPLPAFVLRRLFFMLLLELLPLRVLVMSMRSTRSGWCLACRRGEGLRCWRGDAAVACGLRVRVNKSTSHESSISGFSNLAALRGAARFQIPDSRFEFPDSVFL